MPIDSAIRNKSGPTPARFAIVGAVLAFLACNAGFILIAIFAAIGINLGINPHIQAAIISLFTSLTLGMVFLVWHKTKKSEPLLLGALGAVIIVGSMYIHFNKIVESIGLLILFTAAIWSWRISR